MYTIPPKKMIIINILDILKKYTDMDHRLTQAEIMDILKKEYCMDVDRKTVKRNLMDLLELDCGIDYTEVARTDSKGNDTTIYTDWYIQREFTDSELRLLIDSVLFSKNIPYKHCRQLIKKLKGLSNIYFEKKVNHIHNLTDNHPQNKELFYTIDVLDEAISKNRKVSFIYNAYGTDKKLHPKKDEEYIINPYQMVAANSRYYLICNYDKYDNLSNYRIDRITGIKMLDEKRKPASELADGDINLPRHMAEHLYMFSGESKPVTFRAKRYIVTDIIDWFGNEVTFTEMTDNEVTARVNVNLQAMRLWAMQYAKHITILSPQSLADGVKEDLKAAMLNYE